jgi:hypothetical protein
MIIVVLRLEVLFLSGAGSGVLSVALLEGGLLANSTCPVPD